MRTSLLFSAIALLCWQVTGSAYASFHIMRISEAMGQFHGDPRIQFVELQMADGGQNFVNGHKIIFQDAMGKKTGEVAFTRDVSNGANGSNILIGTQAFADAFDIRVDFLLPEGLMNPYSGRVCFDTIDCLAYGEFSGDNPGYGSPASRFPVDSAQDLTLLVVTPPGPGRNNSLNYALRDPTPRNNASDGSTQPTFACFVTDNFATMSQWDQAADGAGLDLESCSGAPVIADIGFADVAQGALVLTPGARDDLQLDVPICLTGLKTSIAKSIPAGSYRVKLDMMARPGIATGACFVRQKYTFNEGADTLDVSQGSGFGINFGFDDAGEITDHLHSDVRFACLQTGEVDGRQDEATYPDFKLRSETKYTIVMDVDGDDASGPLTLQVKLYPADQAEPPDYLATFILSAGLNAVEDEALEHGFLMAALGLHESSMVVTNFSICPIPRNQKHVREVICTRLDNGTICAFWQNPFDAETDKPILISVNGGESVTLAGTATEHTLLDPPEGEVTISIKNYSGIAVTCTVCENNPPEVIITAPETVPLVDGTATIAFDSSASTDGDHGLQTLGRFWEIISTPPEGNASLGDPGAVVLSMNVNAIGDYKVQLTITDSGCEGDQGQIGIAQRTVTVRSGPGEGFQKPGDENQDGKLDLSDSVALLNYLFTGTNPALACGNGEKTDPANIALLDANADGKLDLSDPVRLLGFLFLGSARPSSCLDDSCPCINIPGCKDTCR